MEMIGNKARVAAVVSAVGLMVIGCVTTTSINAEETKTPIDVEVVPEQEPADRTETANLTRELQNKRKPLQKNKLLRGVHPKSHGCVDATFTVLKFIDSAYQVGLFAHPATYNAKIRYSNASVLQLPDLKGGNGSRGMAIKVLGVNGPIMLLDGDARNQDFLMINTPEFAFANVRDYLRLTRVLIAHRFGADPRPYFVPAELFKFGIMNISGKLKPPEPGESPIVTGMRQIFLTAPFFGGFSPADVVGTLISAKAVQKIKDKTVRNPLQVQYFSAAPFRFGPERVMKFSVVPAAGEVPQKAFSPEEIGALDDNYLAQALKKNLTQGKTLHLSFMIQAVEESQLAGRKEAMIENAALAWSEEEFPFVKVAHIAIHPVGKNEQLVDACESLQFTPWHALAAHEPLGGINRLRKPVYCESAEFRSNGGNPDQVLCQGTEYN